MKQLSYALAPFFVSNVVPTSIQILNDYYLRRFCVLPARTINLAYQKTKLFLDVLAHSLFLSAYNYYRSRP